LDFLERFSGQMREDPLLGLRLLEIMPWEYVYGEPIFGDRRHALGREDYDDVFSLYKKLFRGYRSTEDDVGLQQRAYTVMKRATEQNIIKKRDEWMGGDQNVLTLLRFPLRGSHENFLQEDALNLSYRYIDRKIEDPKLQ